MTDEAIKDSLTQLLNACLEGANQECSFNIMNIYRVKGTVTIKFPLEIIEEDNFAGFAGY